MWNHQILKCRQLCSPKLHFCSSASLSLPISNTNLVLVKNIFTNIVLKCLIYFVKDLQYYQGVGATVCRHLPLLDGSVQVHSRWEGWLTLHFFLSFYLYFSIDQDKSKQQQLYTFQLFVPQESEDGFPLGSGSTLSKVWMIHRLKFARKQFGKSRHKFGTNNA